MTAFFNLLTQKIIISRLTAVSGDKTHYETLTAEMVNIQRMDDTKAVNVGGSVGKTFRLYAEDGTDIQKGDRLAYGNSEYKVIAVSDPAPLGNFQHKEITIVKVK